MKYKLEWSEWASLVVVEGIALPIVEETDTPWNQPETNIHFAMPKDQSGAYIPAPQFRERSKKHAEFFLEPKNIELVIDKYEELLEELADYRKTIAQEDFSEIKKERLVQILKKHLNFIKKTAKWYKGSRPEAEPAVEKEVQKRIKELFPEENTEEIFNLLTRSPYPDPINKERKDWIEILEGKMTNEILLNHAKKYPPLFTNLYTEKELLNVLRNRYQEDKKSLKDMKKDLEEDQNNKNKVIERQKKYLEKIKDEKFLTYLKLYHLFGVYRFKAKPGIAGMEVVGMPMLKVVADKLGLSVRDMHECLTGTEILEHLKKGTKPNKELLDKRKKCRVFMVKGTDMTVMEGEEAKEFVEKELLHEKEDKKELKGMPASPGKVKGIAKIVRANRMDEVQKAMKRFNKGEILITPNTQPNMVPLMKKAAAIVSEIGGLTSHTAIVSREFRIPCIVGVEDATHIIKDGEEVEVDAKKGLVRRL